MNVTIDYFGEKIKITQEQFAKYRYICANASNTLVLLVCKPTYTHSDLLRVEHGDYEFTDHKTNKRNMDSVLKLEDIVYEETIDDLSHYEFSGAIERSNINAVYVNFCGKELLVNGTHNFISMDASGRVYSWENKPSVQKALLEWVSEAGDYGKLEYLGTFDCNKANNIYERCFVDINEQNRRHAKQASFLHRYGSLTARVGAQTHGQTMLQEHHRIMGLSASILMVDDIAREQAMREIEIASVPQHEFMHVDVRNTQPTEAIMPVKQVKTMKDFNSLDSEALSALAIQARAKEDAEQREKELAKQEKEVAKLTKRKALLDAKEQKAYDAHVKAVKASSENNQELSNAQYKAKQMVDAIATHRKQGYSTAQPVAPCAPVFS